MPQTDTTAKAARFPLAQTAMALTGGALGVGLAMAVLMLWLPGWSGGLPAVAFAAAVAWLAALASLLPLAAMGHHGVSPAVTAYFAGMAGRVLVCALAAVLGIFALGLGAQPLLLGLAGMYLPLLMIEALLVGRYLSRMDAPSAPAGAAPTGQHKEAMV